MVIIGPLEVQTIVPPVKSDSRSPDAFLYSSLTGSPSGEAGPPAFRSLSLTVIF